MNVHRKVSCGEQGISNDEVRNTGSPTRKFGDWQGFGLVGIRIIAGAGLFAGLKKTFFS
jgi:hypothetical protein